MKSNFKLNLSKEDIKRKTFAVVVGNFFCALALVTLLKPNHMIPAGVMGMSTLISYVSGISVSTLIILINLPLLLLGVLKLKKEFMFFSTLSIFIVSFYVSLITRLLPADFMFTNNPILAATFGGAINGFGMGITLRYGTSTGGFDIVATLIRKNYNLKIGSVLMGINFVLIAISGFIFTRETAMFTLISLFVGYQVSDRVQLGVGKQKQVIIVSRKYAEISSELYKNLKRGMTYMKGEGVYNKEDLNVIFLICSSRELVTVRSVVDRVDKNSFMAVSDTSEILGSGFQRIEI
jgi:uncharacterized membrane-anchored protein YitT (DUF2179 family)